MSFFKRIFGKKGNSTTETITVLGKDYVIDLSQEAQRKRKENYEIIKQNSWKEVIEVDFVKDDGTIFFKRQTVNTHEEDLTGFYGTMRFSPDKKYCVVFVDAGNDKEKGKVALVETESQKLLYSIEVNRPRKCNVSNTGLVSCNDSNSRQSKSTTFYVYDLKGNTHFSQRINENIGDICLISSDGNYAAFDTCTSYSLKIVDVMNKKIIKTLSKDNTNKLEIDLDQKTIILHYVNGTNKAVNF
jgi:hypothetical protein